METHVSLKYLLDTLFAKMDLYTWTIYEEKSGATSVRLRFVNSGTVVRNNGLSTVAAYKKKSPAQMARDRRRAEEHHSRVTTRNQARLQQHSVGDVENFRHGDNDTLSVTTPSYSPEIPVPNSDLDPLASPFEGISTLLAPSTPGEYGTGVPGAADLDEVVVTPEDTGAADVTLPPQSDGDSDGDRSDAGSEGDAMQRNIPGLKLEFRW